MDKKKMSLTAFILMILTSVFGVANIGLGFFRMGYAAIPLFILAGILFFIPFIFMVIEFGTGFKGQKGGIFTWMKNSVNVRFAFIGVMMWYASYVIWMFGKSLSFWIPLSYAIFGKDITTTEVLVGGIDFGPFLLGVIGVLLILLIAKLVIMGPGKFAKISAIGGIAVIALNLILLLGGIAVFFVNGMELSQPLTANSLVQSPNANYQDIIPFLGFTVMAVFAYGGVEAMGGVSEDLENPHRDLKRGILIAGVFIVIAYVFGFLMVGSIMPWDAFPEKTGSLSALFEINRQLGTTLGGAGFGDFLARLSGIGIAITYFGALIALSYAPLSQLVDGTDKTFWPKSFEKVNENGVRVAAVKTQTIIVLIFIALKSVLSLISPDGASTLFELIVTMTNVGMTLPYLFIIYAWLKYRNNDSLPKDIIIFKGKTTIMLVFVISFIMVLFGNVFTIIEPFLANPMDLKTGIWTIIGPIVFALLAIALDNNRLKKERNTKAE